MKIAVTSLGVKGFPENFAKILEDGGFDAKFYPYDREVGYSRIPFDSVDVFWHIGGFFSFDVIFDKVKKVNPKIKTVLTWVGTDIINFNSFIKARPKCLPCMLKNIDIHVVDYEGFKGELRNGLGIQECYFVPSVPEPMPLSPLPSEFTVACYIPPHRAEFYGFPIIVEAARQLPDVPFYIFPSASSSWRKIKPPLPNIHLMHFVQGDEKLEWWSRCSCFISIPVHSGFSLMAIEFLQMGRRVIMNKNHPYVYYVEETVKPDDIVNYLREIREFNEPDREASEYYHKEYSYEKVVEHVKPILESIE